MTNKPQMMCFAWPCNNDTIQREICIVLAAAIIPTRLTKITANNESLCRYMLMSGTLSTK